MIEVEVRGVKALARALGAIHKEEVKALETSIKAEGFQLMKVLKKEIEAGAPGGKRFAPLSFLARKRGRGSVNRTPLGRLAKSVRYQIRKDPYQVKVGWVGSRVSKSWKRIAAMQQEGFSHEVTEEQRSYLRRAGGRLGKRSKYRKFYFLRESTKELRTPARPILKPFWAAYGDNAWRNIRDNYRRKVRGEIIYPENLPK